MENWLLGHCLYCPDGISPGRIVVLASLRKNVHGDFVKDHPASKLVDDIGPTNCVFWPQDPPASHNLGGCLVRFKCVQGPEHGDPTTPKDWMRVARNMNGWEVERFGFRIVDLGQDIQWMQEPRWAKGLPEGELIFIHRRAKSTILGLWRVGRELPGVPRGREILPHPNQNKVFEYAIKSLDNDSIYIHTPPNSAKPVEHLLYAPDESNGQPVDLLTPKQLAKWVVDRMVAAAPETVARFDKESPGWRTKIRDEIEGYGEPERHVARARWERFEGILNDLVLEAEWADKLLQHPKFLARVEDLAKSHVEAKVTARASEIETEAQQSAKITIQRIEKEIGEIHEQLKEAKDRRDEVLRDLQSKLVAIGEREQVVKELITHLVEARERMLRDLAIYQSVLPGTISSPVVNTEIRPTDKPSPYGPAITDAIAFVETRLWPGLDQWHRGIPRTMSIILHAAVCGSKAVIVPSPAWARAYTDSLGTQARLTVVNVQPIWLGFEDLWRGGLGCIWERATRDDTTVELVFLRDFNRALPQCYARPLLDMIAGYADTLPDPGSGCWPRNLRLMACPSLPDESLPLTTEVVHHFAAVPRIEVAETSNRASSMTAGHVPVDSWYTWCIRGQSMGLDEEFSKEFGPLACAAAADVATITQVLRTFGMGEREAKQTAREIRVTGPAEYLLQSSTDTGMAR